MAATPAERKLLTWWKLDDQSNNNPKLQALLRSALSNDLDGVAAYAMWNAAGAATLARYSDGVVTEADLISIFLNRTKVRKWAKRLVDADLWHLPGHDCIRCPPSSPAPGCSTTGSTQANTGLASTTRPRPGSAGRPPARC
ncbi:hypothetical protein AHiyo4_07710 [Arthrobacter sp. Hiyo4]|nr:hypothetical protein AHiyo4_07710 [Arthrobacter sp. Hiyo4]